MSTVYIISDKGKLSKEGERLVFLQIDGTKQILFPFKIEILVLIGNVSISGDAFRLLSRHKIPVTFLSSNGRFNGKFVYGESKNVFLRQKQYLISADESESLEIAKMIAVGKMKNQVSFMQRIKRKNDTTEEIENAIVKTKKIIEDAQNALSVESLRGYEGNASRLYFDVFRFNLLPEWADFPKRSRNPPETNVNAVLSFLYTLLSYRVEAAIESAGLDSMVGNLHAMNYGENSLVFDIIEEFRTPIADTVCCSLFNLGQLSRDDFREVDFSQDSEDYPLDDERSDDSEPHKMGILLTKDGMKATISAFEKKMQSLVLYEPEKERISYQKIIFSQVLQYKRYISGEQKEYTPFFGK